MITCQVFCIDIPQPVDKTLFGEAIKRLPESVYRIKGTIEFQHEKVVHLFQFVNGRSDISEFHNPQYKDRYLIIIGQNLQEEKIRTLFNSLFFPDKNEKNKKTQSEKAASTASA